MRKETAMRDNRWSIIIVTVLVLLTPIIKATGADLTPLADCSAKVFNEINRTKSWSGKPPEGCPAKVTVSKTVNGAQVTAWFTDVDGAEWVMTALTVLMGYRELADATALVKGNKEILLRVQKLGDCLDSIVKRNDPAECRYKSSKEYFSGDKMGVERHWEIWLDDDRRKSVINYIIGDTEQIPYPPVDLGPAESLPPGTDLHLLIR
ncbi:hypothetical protein KI809_19955 [Geobacter pelophilus]|uniref:Uncharacterized protein n=1 Tax=Geoanaerobacter pelophilus TaxID=60036 RepID=A0AAW4LAG5_9BACT|nr:hypothetical protein [Geoanaerobacter pelophilus]